MKNINKILTLGILLCSLVLYSCDTEEESIGFKAGENLLIAGSGDILTFASGTYNVEGFTVDETYTWAITGPGTAVVTPVTGRDGEFVTVTAEDAGLYELSVSNGTLTGTTNIDVTSVNQFLGVGADTIRVFENQFNGSGDTLVLSVNISERNVFATTATFSVVSGTATEGVDYDVLNENNTLTFAAGETEAFVKVLLSDNQTIDGIRDFSIVLDNVTTTGIKNSAVTLAPDSLNVGQTVVFIDDDIKTVNFNTKTDTVEVNDAGNYFINVELSKAMTEDVVINYSVVDENSVALVGVDKTNGTVNIFAGQTSTSITLDILDSFVADGASTTTINVLLQSVLSSDGEVVLGASDAFTIEAEPAE